MEWLSRVYDGLVDDRASGGYGREATHQRCEVNGRFPSATDA